jgi:hypothetical protein
MSTSLVDMQREAVWKGRLDPLREGLDSIDIIFAQRLCRAISNHFPHSLRPSASLRVTVQTVSYDSSKLNLA